MSECVIMKEKIVRDNLECPNCHQNQSRKYPTRSHAFEQMLFENSYY